ncbi:hypothetical protein, partial [Kingella kingae]|uniref:hypothetical protein n=1 Tax=Kingella kingae TaxID=504 RepID=UPI001E342966
DRWPKKVAETAVHATKIVIFMIKNPKKVYQTTNQRYTRPPLAEIWSTIAKNQSTHLHCFNECRGNAWLGHAAT